MLILLYYATMNFCVAIMVDLIILFGILLLLETIGIKTLNKVGQIIRYLFRCFGKAIKWIFLRILKLIPTVFTYSKKALTKLGISNELLKNFLAVLATIIVVLIII